MNDMSLADISSMSWDDLRKLRSMYNSDPAMQQLLAPLEHRAYAREYVQRNPRTGPVAMAGAVPAWQLAKMFGIGSARGSRSKPSIDQLFAGYQGMFEGMGSMR